MEHPDLTPDAIIVRSQALLCSHFGTGEIVMMDLGAGNYYGLESVAARIWELIEQPMPVRDICDQLVAEYRISPEECHEEVLMFLGDLLNRNIVALAGPAAVDAGI